MAHVCRVDGVREGYVQGLFLCRYTAVKKAMARNLCLHICHFYLQSATVCIAFSFIIRQVRRMALYDFSLKPLEVFIVKIH